MMRRILKWGGLAVAGVLLVLVAHLAAQPETTVFSWKRPDTLGLKDGRLAPCPRSPNCVSSQADPSDTLHHLAPIVLAGGTPEAMAAARAAVAQMRGARVIRQDGAYLHAEMRSRWLGFVDDLELVHDAGAGLLHVRSASRLGRRDFGVNRARVEALRRRLASAGRN